MDISLDSSSYRNISVNQTLGSSSIQLSIPPWAAQLLQRFWLVTGVLHLSSSSLDTELGAVPVGSLPTVASSGEMSDGSEEKVTSPRYC